MKKDPMLLKSVGIEIILKVFPDNLCGYKSLPYTNINYSKCIKGDEFKQPSDCEKISHIYRILRNNIIGTQNSYKNQLSHNSNGKENILNAMQKFWDFMLER